VAGGTREQSDTAHEGAADAENMDMHENRDSESAVGGAGI
jgi:hypothetical protein